MDTAGDDTVSRGVALGNFDGVHLGHREILRHLVSTSRKKRWLPCVYTLKPHPAKLLSPKTAPKLIQTEAQKKKILQSLGIKQIVFARFDKTFSRLPPEVFFEKILQRKLKAAGVWVGYDFTFGSRRSGDAALLKELCRKAGILCRVAKARFSGETLISSTHIRRFVRHGEMREAARLLGRPFALMGSVVKGFGIGGKELGIHTANLKVENELLPKIGIYVTRTIVPGGKTYASATSVGNNPTYPGKPFSVETHLIGFQGTLRGKKIEIQFLNRLRDEFKFPNSESLKNQIEKDIAAAKKQNATLRYHR